MEALAPRMAIQALLAERDDVSTAGVCSYGRNST